MEAGRCQGTTASSKPCGAKALPGNRFCPWHSPEYAERRKAWSAKGGKRRSNLRRAEERLPPDLHDLKRLLFGALAKTMNGGMTPAVAQAVGSLARAIVAVHTAGEVDERLAAVEEALRREGKLA